MSTRRHKWFSQARFGMFIHWGLYSILGRGEWVMDAEKIPLSEYEKLITRFNPEKFNAKEWVSLAKSAGMKYMVLTTKHHDGFCLFDSKLTDYTSKNSPAKKDFVAEFVEACRKEGMKIGFYYSLLDWHHSDYQASPAKGTLSKKYIDYYHGQVRELCTNYGKIDIMWFDGEWDHSYQQWKSKELVRMIRKLQPDILINNRLGHKGNCHRDDISYKEGDFGTPEQTITAGASDRLWESCMTMNDHWGYAFGDHNWKTTTQLIHNLVRCVAGGGNYLLNVGPKPDGTIPLPSVRRLKKIGSWIKINGKSIYGA
ncbi:MAG: alpha-L-fucosidase [Candidatus Omnitrophota bacterium]